MKVHFSIAARRDFRAYLFTWRPPPILAPPSGNANASRVCSRSQPMAVRSRSEAKRSRSTDGSRIPFTCITSGRGRVLRRALVPLCAPAYRTRSEVTNGAALSVVVFVRARDDARRRRAVGSEPVVDARTALGDGDQRAARQLPGAHSGESLLGPARCTRTSSSRAFHVRKTKMRPHGNRDHSANARHHTEDGAALTWHRRRLQRST